MVEGGNGISKGLRISKLAFKYLINWIIKIIVKICYGDFVVERR